MEDSLNNRYIEKAVTVLNQGGIIIYPTDTAFGIGCRIDNPKAIEKLFFLRKRPQIQAVPVLVAGIKMAENYLLPLSEIVRELMLTYWPGPLTVVYKCNPEKTPLLVRGGGRTLGVRMPNHKIALELIQLTKIPLLGPSANFHSLPTPYRFSDLDKNLLKLVDFIIPGECLLGKISTVVDCTKTPVQIIRKGAQEINKRFLK